MAEVLAVITTCGSQEGLQSMTVGRISGVLSKLVQKLDKSDTDSVAIVVKEMYGEDIRRR